MIERYCFEDIPELSRAESGAANALARLLPGAEAASLLRAALETVLEPLQESKDEDDAEPTTQPGIGVAQSLANSRAGSTASASWDGGLFRIHRAALATSTPDVFETGIRATLVAQAGADGTEVFVETPLENARTLISRVVGVPVERLGASDLLTPVEEGILTFFAERIAVGLAEHVPWFDALLPIRLPRVACETGRTQWGSEGPHRWFVVKGSVKLTGMSLPFRMRLPWAALEAVSTRYAATEDGSTWARRRMTDTFRAAETETHVELTGRIGTVPLTPSDMSRLERNDIVLVDAEDASLEGDALGGQIRLGFAGYGVSSSSILAEIVEDAERLQIRVMEMVAGEVPANEEADAMANGAATASEGVPMDNDRTQKIDLSELNAAGAQGDGESEDSDDGAAESSGDAPQEAFEGSGRALVEETPITLRVEVGRIRMTLRELAQLNPGSILELHKDASAPVSLLVEDRVMGQGELVRVDGELGVRILRLR